MAVAGSGTPWSSLPKESAAALRPVIEETIPRIVDTIQREVPQYSRPMEGRFGEGVRRGVGVALERFLDLPGTTEPALTEASRHVYWALGRGEVRQGRSLESLLAAYRTGARVVFRSFADHARANGQPTEVVVSLGEAIFAYIDELSAASVEGYAHEQSDRATDLERRRTEIADLLLAGGTDETSLARLAALVGWRVPDDVRVVAVPRGRDEGLRLALGPDCVTAAHDTGTFAVVPATFSRTELGRALRDRGAVVGPVRPWPQAPDSQRLALLLPGTDAEPVWVDDHLLDVVLAAEPTAVGDLARRLLAPLDDERPASRERLLETLGAWLAHDGRRADIGAELHIHPQTVGYRVTRLRELFGDALDDPTTRFELELVLRARAGDQHAHPRG